MANWKTSESSAAVVARAVQQRRMHGARGAATARLLAAGDGWSVKDVLCTHGRSDRPFQEQHNAVAIALVLAGTFQYRRGNSYELLAPGALMLGNYGECFECDHDHATGDRCVAFHFSPEYFERIAADAGFTSALFQAARIPPIQELGRLSGAVAAALKQPDATQWEQIALEMAARALSLANHTHTRRESLTSQNLSRITESIRLIDANPTAPHTIQSLATSAGVSTFYYLRVFERVTGVTPHQFILRARLRHAARCIADDSRRISEIAFSAGFGDLSNFNHAFRAEFGMTPVQWRKRLGLPLSSQRH